LDLSILSDGRGERGKEGEIMTVVNWRRQRGKEGNLSSLSSWRRRTGRRFGEKKEKRRGGNLRDGWLLH